MVVVGAVIRTIFFVISGHESSGAVGVGVGVGVGGEGRRRSNKVEEFCCVGLF